MRHRRIGVVCACRFSVRGSALRCSMCAMQWLSIYGSAAACARVSCAVQPSAQRSIVRTFLYSAVDVGNPDSGNLCTVSVDADGRLRGSCLQWKGERQDPTVRSPDREIPERIVGASFISAAALPPDAQVVPYRRVAASLHWRPQVYLLERVLMSRASDLEIPWLWPLRCPTFQAARDSET
jgi:hypothetical protein